MPDARAVLGNREGVDFLTRKGFAGPRVGFVLGSGWGHFVDSTEVVAACPYGEIPGFGESTVKGHAGRLVRGRAGGNGGGDRGGGEGGAGGREYLAMQGRLHHYEGHPLGRIGSTVAVLEGLGVRELVVTCAAGGVDPAYEIGDLVLITDYINFMLASPVRGMSRPVEAGAGGSAGGPEWPAGAGDGAGRCGVSGRLRLLAEEAAEGAGISLREGVLFSSKGPSYETPAEVRMARFLGGDLVSMSTAPELIAAAALGVEAIAIACVTNLAPGVVPGREVNHEEVIEVMEARKRTFSALLAAVLERFSSAAGGWRPGAVSGGAGAGRVRADSGPAAPGRPGASGGPAAAGGGPA